MMIDVTAYCTSLIQIYTTEPTFVIDLGIIMPCSIAIGIGLLKRTKWAYMLASVFMTLFSFIGPCVILAIIFQHNYRIGLRPES